MPDRTAGQSEGERELDETGLKAATTTLAYGVHATKRAEAKAVIAAYLAAVSPVGVEGEDEATRALRTLVFLKDLKDHSPATYEKMGKTKDAAWAEAREVLRRSASPSSPTGEKR